MQYFSDAARWAPDAAEIRFNLARSLYEFHSYAEAALSFEHTARIAGDRHLKALSKVGQGNALFRDATVKDARPAYSIPRLRAAIDSYRAALQLEPELFNAELNIKVAERRLRELQQKASGREPPPAGSSRAQPSTSADDILRGARRPSAPRVLSKPAGVDKDW
jgi:tetratricopeptide (TPR) repeat protein